MGCSTRGNPGSCQAHHSKTNKLSAVSFQLKETAPRRTVANLFTVSQLRTHNSQLTTRYFSSSLRGIPIVEPRLGGVRVAAHLPEAPAIGGEKLDLPDPLRAFPRIELRSDHAARPAVLARKRLALPCVNQQHI